MNKPFNPHNCSDDWLSNDFLQKKGEFAYNWASRSMTIIEKIVKKNIKNQPLKGLKVGLCLHITKETSVLAMALNKLGAEISICSANPLSVQKEIAYYLSNNNIKVFAKPEETVDQYHEFMRRVLNENPDIITDDGGELHSLAHDKATKSHKFIGGTEETTSGFHRLKIIESKSQLRYPVIVVNNALTKHMFDNRYGTGQSTVDGLLRTTGIFLPGKHVVICGFGWVGKGISAILKGYGCKITITEVNPVNALEAFMEGFNVCKLDEAAPIGDVFITCTGQIGVIRKEHIEKMKDGVFLANVGHFDVEIDTGYLYKHDPCNKEISENITCFSLDQKKVYLLAKGRVLNLVGSSGHSSEVMALSFANQLLSIVYLSKNHNKLENKIYSVPQEIDKMVADYALGSYNIKIDKLTKKQKKYQGILK